MVQKLQEKCREARDRLGYTNQDIADATGIPLSSVKNFFAATSKVPGLVYAGLICKFLGVSIDECLCITPAEDVEARLRRQLKEDRMNSENQRLTEVNGLRKELDKSRLSTILVLSVCRPLGDADFLYRDGFPHQERGPHQGRPGGRRRVGHHRTGGHRLRRHVLRAVLRPALRPPHRLGGVGGET